MVSAEEKPATASSLVDNLSSTEAKAETTSNPYQRIVPFILFILALFLLFKLVQPLIAIILGSVLLAYISFPIYTRIHRRVRSKSFSIILALFVIVIIALIPFSFLLFEVVQQGYYFYGSLSHSITDGALFGFGCVSKESAVCALLNDVERFSAERLSTLGFDTQLQNLLPVVEGKLTMLIIGIPLILAQIFLSLVIAYFIVADWEGIVRKIADLLPMRPATIERLFTEFDNIAHTVIYAQLFVAAVQGVLGAVALYFLGVPFPIFLGVVMAFCALIPSIGTAIIWLPVSVLMMLIGYFAGDYWLFARGIILFVFGSLVISVIDNVLLAKIVKTKARVNQILVIVGVIGGAALFGVVGIFVGPILLPLLMTYFETFKERFV